MYGGGGTILESLLDGACFVALEIGIEDDAQADSISWSVLAFWMDPSVPYVSRPGDSERETVSTWDVSLQLCCN